MTFSQNSLIHCDALPLMERMDNSCVDLIYLDPFWYGETKPEDKFPDIPQVQALIQAFQQSLRILTDCGNLFIFLGSETRIDLHKPLREIFGIDNFVTEFIVPRRIASNVFRQRHDKIILYRKSNVSVFNNRVIRRTEQEIQSVFPNRDERGRYRLQSLFSPFGRATFEWNGVVPPSGSSWRFSKDRLDQLMNDGLIEATRKTVSLKSYASLADTFRELQTIWTDLESGANKWSKHGSKSQPGNSEQADHQFPRQSDHPKLIGKLRFDRYESVALTVSKIVLKKGLTLIHHGKERF